MTVEPSYFTETLPQGPQSIQLVIPGPPDSPEIFTKSVSPEEFVIEWGEPRLYGGVRVRGYQVRSLGLLREKNTDAFFFGYSETISVLT